MFHEIAKLSPDKLEKRNALIDEWVKALCSDKYLQATGMLYCEIEDENKQLTGKFGYCCLGVAQQEFAPNARQVEEYGTAIRKVIWKKNGVMLTPGLVAKFGFSSGDPTIRNHQDTYYGCNLASLNDDLKLTFPQIARVIDKQRNWLW